MRSPIVSLPADRHREICPNSVRGALRQFQCSFDGVRLGRCQYDATRLLTEFCARQSDDAGADLRQLSERLVAMVDETMQPAAVSLWLKDIA